MNTPGTIAPVPFSGQPAVDRVALAQQAYRDFYAQCFWSCRPDLEITEDKIPMVIRGLRENAGRKGYQIAALLWR